MKINSGDVVTLKNIEKHRVGCRLMTVAETYNKHCICMWFENKILHRELFNYEELQVWILKPEEEL